MKARLAMVVITLLAALFVGALAKAEQPVKPGLWWESETSAEGVSVRRLRDTSNGVVCYIAKERLPNQNTTQPSIDCVKP